MTSRLRIVVTGLIAQHPELGGVAWDYLQYPVGLARLGHDVYYLEDSGEWPYTLNGSTVKDEWIAHDPAPNIRHLERVMERFGLGGKWMYRFPIKPRWYGLSHRKRREVLASADLLINVSGTLVRPWDYGDGPRLAYLDSDPVFTQLKLVQPRGQSEFRKRVAAHDVHFTFGERFAEGAGYRWIPTRQPVLLSEWQTTSPPREAFTTVMSWTSYRPVRHRGQAYGQKDMEFEKFIDLPQAVAETRLEVALGGTHHVRWRTNGWEGDPRKALRRAGWNVVDARRVGGSVEKYRAYVTSSKAEWSVAKNGYVRGQPGWFSCRSACYLAAGRPVVVQETGFSDVLPAGEGILPFSTPDGAIAAIEEVEGHYGRHAHAATAIAEEWFDSRKVLPRLVEDALHAAA
jgi:hypothetical protein